MKKLLLLSTIALLSLQAVSQRAEHDFPGSDNAFINRNRNRECGTMVEKADSVVRYSYDSATGNFTPFRVSHYSYNRDFKLTGVVVLSLPEREFIYRQTFEYNTEGNITKYLYDGWTGTEWRREMINNRTYDPAGRIQTEDFVRENATGIFEPYQRHFYNWDGDRIATYLRQVKNAAGEWYDLSYHNYVYDSYGRLTVLYGKYISSGLVFWERTSVYDTEGKVAERYLRILRYNTELKQNVLNNELYQKNSYNIFGNIVEIMNHEYINGQWSFTGVDSTYYSMLPANRKVSICHNGQTICVSVNAVRAHLEHGDKLGECTGEEDNNPGKNNRNLKAEEPKFTLYPNPATSIITVSFNPSDNPYSTGYLMAPGGRIVRTFNAIGSSELTLDLSGLKPGNYVVRINKPGGKFDSRSFIKR